VHVIAQIYRDHEGGSSYSQPSFLIKSFTWKCGL